jgi:hypothetical protein
MSASVVSPPEPSQAELELLIREARARQRRRWLAAAAAVALASGAALGSYSVASGGHVAQGARSGAPRALAAARCNVAAGWRLRLGPLWAEETGQHTAPFVLTRQGTAPCSLRGYPAVVLLDAAGRALPFRYSHRGDQMVTGRAPRPVAVAGRGSAYFVLNKYRCDVYAQDTARFVQVQLPGMRGWLRLRLPHYPLIDYCPGEPPSTTIAVTPLVGSFGQAAAHD